MFYPFMLYQMAVELAMNNANAYVANVTAYNRQLIFPLF